MFSFISISNETASSEDPKEVTTDVLIGLVFCIGIVLSFLPQHVACWKARSADGLSLSTLNFCTVSMCTRLLATFLGDHSNIAQVSGLLPKIAVSMPTLQAALIVVPGIPTYLVYYFMWYPRWTHNENDSGEHGNHVLDEEEETSSSRVLDTAAYNAAAASKATYTRRRNWEILSTVATLAMVAMATVASVLALIDPIHYDRDNQIELWGGVATLTNAIMWLPQIMDTWQLQSGGVLSILALFFSAFGDFLLGAYWVFSGETFWVWSSLVADSSMQMVLLGLLLSFQRRDRLLSEAEVSLVEPLLESGDESLALENCDESLPAENGGDIEASEEAS